MTAAPCSAPPCEELLQAITEFNRGDWFEAHETLEELWVGAKGELRDFYQGLLQLAVALHHWQHGNYKGAFTLFKGGVQLLERVGPVCAGVEVARLRDEARALEQRLERVPEGERDRTPARLEVGLAGK